MKVRFRTGAATHSGPASCGGTREGAGEALIGEAAGQPLSREIGKSGVPTPLSYAEGNTKGGATRDPLEDSMRSKALSMRKSPSYRRSRQYPQPIANGGRPSRDGPRGTWNPCISANDT